ncbi:MAG: phosphoribosyl-AMP cyclohydrolase [Candidatus Omnitrophica bacterium CG12_big_fil_rev_8_21_14_0_65_43_15]|uniref:Phosphoribosyl-AMP cyclohydrolase n=1 Tax=Candidatus Taenaricola geysiri TaxID=1974752 RepID=A0A2J0LF70_9BACT|nr:MAG: phosphoribosyl-AMP cyclohydrolase [Candidatus Omnitrophica bacterium CG03_land_8_20_14_0_80_43_22]PIW66482.1 MAG: phosphoribosyl-AMP cyclohydrolase [Candidatus Omnitrophica bacterium CG12_big_fil_rev_8_21_14_0_65_43_15]PIY84781.1 MAG: phosphoribosyl-AMP cyclohydrolase [Candidatus Omnitrophica bacterium CG_4_10_14_0_8_um_filter_43_18]PJC46580.1 MAG: phosphoribosyl-AMP cyclohydrolase [Candidatus Omnitrophica bacterium CG_4_9_14_0_2_um_filter_43_12]
MIELKFNEQGLIPAVVQDYKTGEVLMVAYMNKESFEKTLKGKKACFYSRSRKTLWLKGESSGNVQEVKEIYIDCDQDCILVKVKQVGDAACHTGYRSCFYRELKGDTLTVVGEKIFDPEKVYKK